MSSLVQHRHDFVLLFDVQDGNPNGDPDAGNLPRVDSETGEGLVTDVCLKRKVRNYVALCKNDEPPYEIYVKEKAVLNRQHERAYKKLGIEPRSKKLPKDEEKAREITRWMCNNFYDIRAFGAVMSTDVNAGQVRGPVQLTFARSVEPVIAFEHAITRMAVTHERDLEKERTMGRKFTIRYGLYRAHGFVSAHLADETGFSQGDLDLLWESLVNMFEHDRSAARGQMATRGLYVFKHDTKLGRAPAHTLFERVRVERIPGPNGAPPPQSFDDFRVIVDDKDLGAGLTLERIVG